MDASPDPEANRAPELRESLRRLLREPDLLLAQLILLAVVALSAVQIVLRYVFNAPLQWPEELSAALVIWLTYLGAIALARRGEHVRVEFLDLFLGPRARRALYTVWDVATVVFLIAVVVGGWQFVQQVTYERLPALRVKLSYVVAIVPIAAAIMVLLYLRPVVRRLRSGRRR